MTPFRQRLFQRTVASIAAACVTFASLPVAAATYEFRLPLQGVAASNAPAPGDQSGSPQTPAPTPSASFSVSAASLSFATVNVGSSSTQFLTLTNSGTGAGDVSVSASSGFSVAHDCPESLAAGASCSANVSFVPAAGGPASGTLSIAGLSVALSGTGHAPAASFAVSPSSLAFPDVEQGDTTTSQAVVLTNTGDADGAVSVATSAGFTVAHDCPASLSAGASCTANVTFAPTATGPAAGTLSMAGQTVGLSGNGLTPTLRVALSGAPSSASALPTFENQAMGSAGVVKSYFLRNVGIVGQVISDVTLDSPTGAFTVEEVRKAQSVADSYVVSCGSGNARTSCAADDRNGSRYNLEVRVRFRPTTIATHNATLTFVHNGNAPTTLSASLSGAGIAVQPQVAVSASLSSITTPPAYGDVFAGSAGSVKTIYLRNVGTAGGIISDVTVASPNGAYSIVDVRKVRSGLSSYTVTCAGGSGNARTGCAVDDRSGSRYDLEVQVRFSPTTVANGQTGTLTFAHNGTGTNPLVVNLTGNGIAAVPTVAVSGSLSSIAAAPTFSSNVGTPQMKSVYLRNVGTVGRILSDVALTGSGAFSIYEIRKDRAGMGSYTTTCASGSGNSYTGCSPDDRSGSRYDLEILVRFWPGSTGAHEATLTFTHNGTGASNPVSVTLTGTGN